MVMSCLAVIHETHDVHIPDLGNAQRFVFDFVLLPIDHDGAVAVTPLPWLATQLLGERLPVERLKRAAWALGQVSASAVPVFLPHSTTFKSLEQHWSPCVIR